MYRLTLATDDERALVVDAMRAAASLRTRAASKASAVTMLDKRAGADVRARAVKLVAMLAQAADLERLAVELEAAVPLVMVSPQLAADPRTFAHPTPAATAFVAAAVAAAADDVVARMAAVDEAAERAGLAEDPITGALPEDEPTDDVATVLDPSRVELVHPASP